MIEFIRKHKEKLLFFSLLFMIVLSTQTTVFADVGDNVDYFDGGSGGGGGDGDGILELIFYLIISALPWPLKIVLIIGLVIGFIVIQKMRGKNGDSSGNYSSGSPLSGRMSGGSSWNSSSQTIPNHTREIEGALKQYDPNFSAGKFLGWSEEVFMTIQQAWMERNWTRIRPFEKEELYRRHQMALQQYISSRTINMMERININQSYFYEYRRDGEYEYLTAYMQVRMNDYVISEDTREVVRGDRQTEHHIKYLLTFMRKTGVLTDAATGNLSTKQCPHCGAPLAITSSGQCEYCDTIVTTGEFDWVLSDLDSIKSDTLLSGGGVQITA